MALATQQDVEVSMLRPLSETEMRYLSDLLERAERLLLARIPDLLDRVAVGRPSPQLVADIEAEMVARVLRAPDNGIMRQEVEGNYSYSLNLQVASGLLDVLGKEWEALGLGSWGSLSPESDGYARQRWGGEVPYPWRFQYAWPARDEVSESWGGWVR